MPAIARLARALDERIGFRAPLRRALARLFPGHWSFLLGEITLFSFFGLVLSGVYLALFYRASLAPVAYHGPYASFAGRALPDAFVSVLELSTAVPFGLVVRRFHHFAAHLFIASLLLHAARVYFTGAFRRPRELTWWVGLVLLALALVNGFSGYCLPFDMRGGTAVRMTMTTLESLPWVGRWVATLVFGAPFPGRFILGRLYIEHVFVGPALIAAFIAVHLLLVVRSTHTDYPGPGRTDRLEVGARLWPVQAARSTALAFLVFGTIALLCAFFPVEAVGDYGPFQLVSSYAPLAPDWFLMWIEGAFRLLPRQLDFHLAGATFTNPFYGAIVLPLAVFGGCAVYPLIDARVYRGLSSGSHVLDRARDRPFRTAFGVGGLAFLVLVSLGVLDEQMASVVGAEVWVADVVWGIVTLGVPPLVFAATLLALRSRTRPPSVPRAPRRASIHVRRKALFWLISPVVVAVAAAYGQWAIAGLPPLPSAATTAAAPGPHGFPAWLRVSHYLNFLFLVVLVRSGLQILMDHPRLYWSVHCTPGTEWVRFTPIEVPRDRVWTSKDDARFLSPWVGLPGGRHTLGLARHWHFACVVFWVLNGLVFYVLLFATGQWRRLVPDSIHVVPDAWAVFVHYATFHLPPEPDGFYRYNALQQLAYFAAVFVLAPLSIVTGPSMSPALVNRFKGYRRLPGNRQVGRSVHFLVMCAWIAFVAAHVTMVAIAGLARNMNHIVMGTDDVRGIGIVLGAVGVGAIVAINGLANWASHRRPRAVQRSTEALIQPVVRALLDRHAPKAEYTKQDISPFFWPNGKMPVSPEWKALAAGGFEGYRLVVRGLVDNPVALSLADLRAMGAATQITLHHCIQGWSGIAAWGGLRMVDLIALVRPKPQARAVVFYSFGEGGEGGQYYDSLTLENVLHPQTMIAYDMNYAPLGALHGAPLRLRVENELGFKMVKWISAIELAADVKHVYRGLGGYNEDNEFFDSMADI